MDFAGQQEIFDFRFHKPDDGIRPVCPVSWSTEALDMHT